MKRILFLAAISAMALGRPATAGQAAPAVAIAPASVDAAASATPDALPERRILVMLKLPPEHYRPSADYGGAGGYGDVAAGLARKRLAARLARDNGLKLLDNWPMPVLGIDCVIMVVPGNEPLAVVASRMSRQRGVAWSQPMNRFETQGAQAATPNDRLFAAQPSARAWRLADLHRMATGHGVKVAVVDSLIDAAHPDLRGQLIVNRDFVGSGPPGPEAHGTGVAGIIGARANNSVGIAGVAPGAHLIGLRACWQQSAAATICDSLSLARAMTVAIEDRADIINLSLTGPRDLLLTRLIEVELRRGGAVVAAVDPRTGDGFPASVPGVVAVAEEGLATGRAGVYNAPGRDVPTTEPGGRWYLVSGNSYAAAHVSGLLALARELNTRKGGRALVSAHAGGGAIDACGTLLLAAGRAGQSCRQGN